MNTIYKISLKIYRAILILIIPLSLIAKFLVGAAGHNSETKNEDYLLFAFVVVTITLLTILKSSKITILVRNVIRFAVIVLISLNIIFLFYGLYDEYLVYMDNNFQNGDNILIAIIILLILLSTTSIAGVLKDKI